LAVASTAAGIGASVYGAAKQASAQKAQANAIAEQNRAMQEAQNQAFQERIAAGNRQTAAQTAAMQQTMQDRNAAQAQMRAQQLQASQQQQDITGAENQQAEALRRQADVRAQDLLAQTTAQQQALAQQRSQQQQAALLEQNIPRVPGGPNQGPEATDPGSEETKSAVARRAAEAATNIRDYGTKIGALGAYQTPLSDIQNAISGTKTGIMPAQQAELLLKAGHGARILPSALAYRQAGELGGSMDALLQSRGQSALAGADLSYGNAVQLANLAQQNSNTLAANRADQAKANAQYQQSVSGIFSGLGQLGLYAGGRFGGWGSSLLPGGETPYSGGGTGIGDVGSKLTPAMGGYGY
jgi:hypothetical protein